MSQNLQPLDMRDGRLGAPLAPRGRAVQLVIGAVVLSVLVLGGLLYHRATSRTNKVALAAQPKGVTVVETRATPYRAVRRYVGTLEPWIQARLGPQYVSAYVDTVLVRPGASVRRGQVVATLDCKSASAQSKAVSMQARALESTQAALSNESGRVTGLLEGGFVSPNEAERKAAESASKEAELLATRARMLRATLEVDDCILRAPFDGEIAERMFDPGAFARPGAALLTLVDRSNVRAAIDVPENDFAIVAPDTPVGIHVLALGKRLTGRIVRRSPAADASTRTVHAEIDLSDPQRQIPVGTSAEISVDVGRPVPATELPLTAATIRVGKATIYVIEGEVARRRVVPVLGERDGSVFVEPSLQAGSRVVLEGRALLQDGDRVSAKAEPWSPRAADAVAAPAGAGAGAATGGRP